MGFSVSVTTLIPMQSVICNKHTLIKLKKINVKMPGNRSQNLQVRAIGVNRYAKPSQQQLVCQTEAKSPLTDCCRKLFNLLGQGS